MQRKPQLFLFLNLVLIVKSTGEVETQITRDEQCNAQLKIFREALFNRELWALKGKL